jgi:hypothetical protein
MGMSNEPEFLDGRPVFVVEGGAGTGKSHLISMLFDDIRAAVQEMHDSNRSDERRLSVSLASSWRVERADVPLPAEMVAAQAEEVGLSSVAKLIRAAAKWGIAAIIAAIISGPIQYEEGNLGHWTPPPITEIVQMSPHQMDELSRQILQQVEQQITQNEDRKDHQQNPESP